MAVEASNLEFFLPSQQVQDRDLTRNVRCVQGYAVSAYEDSPVSGIQFSSAPPPLQANLPHFRGAVCELAPPRTSVNADSHGLTDGFNPAVRKRSRDTMDFPPLHRNGHSVSPSSFFAGDDASAAQILGKQLDVHTIISQYTRGVVRECVERQKQQARLLVAAIGEGAAKKLKEKERQIHRIGNLNIVLQERVESLYAENQLWRDVAQTNEAAANSLRSDLENFLAHVGGEERMAAGAPAEEEDAESCCGSSDDILDQEAVVSHGRINWCKSCGERESCVLLLPCRHLCLCGVCGGGSRHLKACPVCYAAMNATLHVNMSP